jgi:uncharacterized iron-regulated membrane protein
VRAALVLLHRYVGLALAGFLILSGLTGSVIAFNHELDAWLNSGLFRTAGEGPALPPLELAARLQQADPRVLIAYLPLVVEPGHSLSIFVGPRIDPATGTAFVLDYSEAFVDPASGTILGRRIWGDCCLERENLIPFIYMLHSSLYVAEPWGPWIMGGVALAWTFDCFVALCLTFPRGRPFLARWRAAWAIRAAGGYRLNVDLHRAGGLWLWGLLLVVTVSGLSLTLYDEVFEPTVSALSPITPSIFDLREPRPFDQPIEPALSLADALAAAEAEAARRGWGLPAFAIYYGTEYGVYGIGFGVEHGTGLGGPWLYVDGLDGRLVDAWLPGEGTAGDTFNQAQFPLHSGQIGGLPTRILASATGLAVAMLSVTGIVIWWKKRAGRQARKARAPARGLAPAADSEP